MDVAPLVKNASLAKGKLDSKNWQGWQFLRTLEIVGAAKPFVRARMKR